MAALAGCISLNAAAQNQQAPPDPVPEPPAPIRAAQMDPTIVEQGVMLLPLESEREPQEWPRTLTIRTQQELPIEGRVLWIIPAADRDARHWTVDTRLVAVADDAVEAHDASQGRRFDPVPYLAAPMPVGYRAELYLGDQRIDPNWCDRLRATDEQIGDGILGVWPDIDRPRADRPDLDSPFEHWRAVLMARADRIQEPTILRFTESEALVARHFAELWDAGLGRLRSQDPATADDCIRLLTRLCRVEPGGARIAGWVATPERTGQLVTTLLDPDLEPGEVVREARAWIDDQPSVLLWSVRNERDEVELAIMNRGLRSLTGRVTWDDIDRADEQPERPQVVRLRAGQVVTLRLARPFITRPRLIGQAEARVDPLTVVRVRTDLGELAAAFTPVRAAVRPPGLVISTFNPMLSLAAVESSAQRDISTDRATVVQVRRRHGRWELFVECHRRDVGDGFVRSVDAGGPNAQAEAASGLPIGVESVVIRIDAPRSLARMTATNADLPAAPITLVIPEEGWWSQVAGPTSGQAQVFRRSWGDRWYARVVIPESWLPDAPESEAWPISMIRTHGDGTGVEFFPGRAPSWNPEPDRAHLDLSEWRSLPGVPFDW